MKNLDPEFCRKVKLARKEAGLRQTQLADEVGCKQSALSMFEQGDGTKLSDEVIEKLAARFGLTIESAGSEAAAPAIRVPAAASAEPKAGFCPNPHCPSNQRYRVEDTLFLRPDRALADPVGGKYCALCGELLERACPGCGAPVHEGAVCSFCGKPYISVL